MGEVSAGSAPRVIGRYRLFGEIASGGAATVHIGRLVGPGGFARTVAIKRLHPQLAKDPEFVAMFLDEARLAARIRHPNVVSILDVVARDGELFLVMEYVQGEALSRLVRAAARAHSRMPPRVASAIMVQALLGLHAAHEATSERGTALGIVHRDVSPQNVLVGVDGVTRVVDFGVAKATSRIHTTRDGNVKGKLAYMSPEQIEQRPVDRRTDIFAAAIVLWEALTSTRLFSGDDMGATIQTVLHKVPDPPSAYGPDVPAEVDRVVLRGLSKEPHARYATAREMAQALERALTPASALEVGEWVERMAGDGLRRRGERVKEVEGISATDPEGIGLFDLADSSPTSDPPPPEPEEASSPDSARRRPPELGLREPRLHLADDATTPYPPPSGTTGLALTGAARAEKHTLRRLGPAVALVAVLSAGAVALRMSAPGWVAAPAGAPDRSAAPADRASAEATVVTTAPDPSTAAPVPVSEPAAAASSAARATAPRSSAAASARPGRTPAPAAAKSRDCETPFVFNPDGTKRFKPECF